MDRLEKYLPYYHVSPKSPFYSNSNLVKFKQNETSLYKIRQVKTSLNKSRQVKQVWTKVDK